jgi:drug/metabolite transporter (DMT)-like permease
MSTRNFALLVVGVVAVSFSAIFVREANAPALTIAFYRNAMAAAILVPLAFARHRDEIRSLRRKQIAAGVLSGLFLAGHFATWIDSLSYTTVAASSVLVVTQPIWIGLMGRFYGEGLRRAAVGGLVLAFLGTLVVFGGDVGTSSRELLGDALALIGAVFAAAYFVAGREVRREMSVLTYVSIVYTVCAVVLLVAAVATGSAMTGFDAKTWWMFVLLTIGPQIAGHTVFNYLLGHLEAAVVAIAIMAEPVGAVLLAMAILNEQPPAASIAGGALILAGVFLAVRAQAREDLDLVAE